MADEGNAQHIAAAVERLTGFPVLGGNNADVVFPSMSRNLPNVSNSSFFATIEALCCDAWQRGEADEFCLSAFDMEDDDATRAFADFIVELRRLGAKLSIIVDQYGAARAPHFLDRLRRAGVEVLEFRTSIRQGPFAKASPLLTMPVFANTASMQVDHFLLRPNSDNQFVRGNHTKALAMWKCGKPTDIAFLFGAGFRSVWETSYCNPQRPRSFAQSFLRHVDKGMTLHGPAAEFFNAMVGLVRTTAKANHADFHAREHPAQRFRKSRTVFDGARLASERLLFPTAERRLGRIRAYAQEVFRERQQMLKFANELCKRARVDTSNFFTEEQRDGAMQVVLSTPTGTDAATNAYKTTYSALAHAQRRVRIVSSVVSVDNQMLNLIENLIRRRVVVQIATCGPRTNSVQSQVVSRNHCRRLQQLGVEIFVSTDETIHAKSIEIDNSVVIEGSMNFNRRSQREDTEAIVLHYDRRLIATLQETNDAIFDRCQRLHSHESSMGGLMQVGVECAAKTIGLLA